MPRLNWLKKEFGYGYDSGNVLSIIPNARRRREEKLIGGSYKTVFRKAILPYINSSSKILEIGPGKGSWSIAILKYISEGELHVVDFQDVEKWLKPEKHRGIIFCHKIEDNSYYSTFKDNYFDFCWSFGVLCHNNLDNIEEILQNTLPKMKIGGIAVHQYADWDKLEKYGWEKGGISEEFKEKEDDEIWWPRNTQKQMYSLASNLGWRVICSDLELVKRDSIIVLQRK